MLSDLQVRQAKVTGKAYSLVDFDGLYFYISATGFKAWHFRFTWGGKRERMSFGGYPALSLKDARNLRDEARAMLAKGINPHSERKRKRHAIVLAGEHTFQAIYDKWLAHRSLSLENEGRQSTPKQIGRVFAKDVFPVLRHLTIYDVILRALGGETRMFNPSGLPLVNDAPHDHPKVRELHELVQWAESMVWSSPERHGAMTGLMKTQIDWIPLSIGAVRPTQGKTLAVMQVSGGSQSFNAINQMRVLGRWMRMLNPFFLKLCSRLVFNPDDVGLVPGMYLPLDYWKLLERDPGIQGPKGGLRITYDNAQRHFDNTAFTTVVSKAWVGTTPSQSQVLQDVIRATLATGKAVAIAIKPKKSTEPRDDDQEVEEEALNE